MDRLEVVQKRAVGMMRSLDSIVSEERWIEMGLLGLKKKGLSVRYEKQHAGT